MIDFREWIVAKENTELPNRIDFLAFLRHGEIRVLVDGIKKAFLVDGIYIDQFRESARKDPKGTYERLKDWLKRGLAQEI